MTTEGPLTLQGLQTTKRIDEIMNLRKTSLLAAFVKTKHMECDVGGYIARVSAKP